MAKWDDPVDTPGDWQREHLQRYVETDGADGHLWNLPWAELRSSPDAPTLLLTTRGRRSGKLRRTPLIYGRDGDRYLVVASAGGAPQHPAWYLNLVADPRVHVQVRGNRFEADARTAAEGEKPRLWQEMTRIWPAYDEYQAKVDRQLPVVILQPVPS